MSTTDQAARALTSEEVVILTQRSGDHVGVWTRHLESDGRTLCGIQVGPSLSEYGVQLPAREASLADGAGRCESHGCAERWQEFDARDRLR